MTQLSEKAPKYLVTKIKQEILSVANHRLLREKKKRVSVRSCIVNYLNFKNLFVKYHVINRKIYTSQQGL